MLPEAIKEEVLAKAVDQFDSSAITAGHKQHGDLILEIAADKIISVLTYLKGKEQFNRLSTITAVDRYPAQPRFEIVYQIQSMDRNLRLRLKVRIGGDKPEIDTATGVWQGANWYEREVFDLFGVHFRNHPNLARILDRKSVV